MTDRNLEKLRQRLRGFQEQREVMKRAGFLKEPSNATRQAPVFKAERDAEGNNA